MAPRTPSSRNYAKRMNHEAMESIGTEAIEHSGGHIGTRSPGCHMREHVFGKKI